MPLTQEFYRIQKLPPYVFAVINEMKAQARAAQQDVIDLGMGNPDGATPRIIVNKMIEAARNPKNHRYSQSKGIAKLREEIVKRYKTYYDVDLDPVSQAIVTIGAKHPASGGREGCGRRDLFHVEELQHGGLAHRLLPGQSEDDRGSGAHQELSGLWCIPAAADRRYHRAARVRGGHPQDLRGLPQAPRRAGYRTQARWMAGGAAARVDVPVGAGAGAVSGGWVTRVFKTADGESAGSGFARDRIRAHGRRSCALRAGGKRAAHQAGY